MSESSLGEGMYVCPFCGLSRDVTENLDPAAPCPRCALSDTPTTRNATKARVGPWHVRQVRNPWAPGMRFDTLLALIKRGQVTKDSVVRGPTTHQLWKRAAEVKGISREFGLCYSCGAEIDTQANLCPGCNRLQEPPANPDVLVDSRGGGGGNGDASMESAPPAPKRRPPLFDRPLAPPVPPASAETIVPPVVPVTSAARSLEAAARAAASFDEPAAIEMSPTTISMSEDDDPLAVTEETEAMARQITGRPPTKQPMVPPSTNAAAAAARQQQQQQQRQMNIRPRQPGADDALLTPQELAAAFQLDFGNAAAAAAANGNGSDGHRRRPRKATAVIAVLLLIAAGAAALLYLRPDLRRKASAWSDDTMNSIKTFISSRTSPATKGTAPGSMATPAHQPMTISPAPPSTPPRSVLVSDAPMAAAQKASVAPPPVPPVPPPLATPAAPPVPAPKSADSAQVANAAVKPDSSKAAGAKPVKRTFATIDEAFDEERRLWSKAIDAEANQDYVEAVRCYQEIQQLPAEVHPKALEVRLEIAKRYVR